VAKGFSSCLGGYTKGADLVTETDADDGAGITAIFVL